MTERFIIIGDDNLEFLMQDMLLLPIYDNKKQLSLKSCCDLLNELHEENEGLKKQITSLKVELDTHKHPLWSTREAERKVSELTDLLSNETTKNAILLKEINSLRKENRRLKEVLE